SDQQQSVISKQIEDLDTLRLARQRAEQEKNTLARELENAKASQTQTQKRLAELEKLSADLESKTKTLGTALDQSTTELSDVQKQLALTREDKAAQTELIQKQTRDLEDLRLARTRLEEERNALTRDLEAAKAASETAQARLSDLAKAGDETRKTEQELENQLKASRAQFADLQSQLARATDDRQVQNDLFRKQTQDLENLRLARTKLEEEKNALIRELETSKAASESVQSRLSELTKAASEARKTEQELENQLQATLAQLAELQSQLAQAAADKRVQNELLGKQTQDLEGLRLARTRIEQERNILARELEAANTASESTQNRLSEPTKTADEPKQIERELGTQLEASRAQLAELQSQLAQAVADKQSQDDLFGIQSKDLEDLRNALTKLEEEKSSLTLQLEAARIANEHAQARLSELANTTSDAPQKEQELEEELEKTKARLSAVQLEFDQALANRKSVEQILSQLKNELAAEQVKANRNLENNEELLKQLKASQALISAQESRLKSLETTIAEEKRIRRQQETRVADIFQRSPASMLREENAQPIPSTEADLFNDQINLIAQTLADQQSRLIVRQQEFALLQSQLKVYEDQIIKFRTDLQETQRQLIENSDRSLTTDEVMKKLRQNLETTKFLARTATIKAENAVSAKARAEWEIRQARKLESRLRSRIRKLERQLGKGKKKYRAKPKKSSVAPRSVTPKADQKQRSHKRSWFYKNNDEKTKRYCKMCLTDH
ncbi:MAG: hypothetical protein ACR2OW_00845, partial [Methyloligellaceae bacterium]